MSEHTDAPASPRQRAQTRARGQEQASADRRRCLLVEDDTDMQAMIADLLRGKGLEVTAVAGLVPAVRALRQKRFSLCLLDLHLGDGHGLQLLEHLRGQNPRVPAIIVTAYGDTPTAVQALKQGADNFIDKPIDTALLYRAIDNALDEDISPAERHFLPLPLIGNSAAVRELRRRCLQRRGNRMMVFLTGAPGSGRALLVDFCHRHGNNTASRLLSSADLADKTDSAPWRELLQILLRPSAHKADPVGTVVIDELGDLPADIWDLLYRIVQAHHHGEPGAHQARLIALSRLGPDQLAAQLPAAAQKTAHKALDILAPYHLAVPPLAARCKDGEALLRAIVERHSRPGQNIALRYTARTRRWLEKFAAAQELMALDSYIRQFLRACPHDDRAGVEFSVPDLSQQDFELLSALDRFRWNRTRAARFLGISLRQIRYRLGKIKVRRQPPSGA